MFAENIQRRDFINIDQHYPDRSIYNCELSSESSVTSRYERTRIFTLAAERQTVQRKTFLKWANIILKSRGIEIFDLFIDLRDGKILLHLLEILSRKTLPSPTLGRMRIHCLENVDKSLYFLNQLGVHLENVGAHDIVDGNSRITLGLLWIIILRFQIQDITLSEVDGLQIGLYKDVRRYSKDALLLWCQLKTADYENVDIQNFTTSWRDGLSFNALIHKHRPDLIQFGDLSINTPLQNLESAFLVAEKELKIVRLFDPEDIYVQQPDEKSIITYVATYYHYFSKLKSENVQARRVDKFISYYRDIQDSLNWCEMHISELLSWIFNTIKWLIDQNIIGTVEGIQSLMTEFKEYRLKEKSKKCTEKGEIEAQFLILKLKLTTMDIKSKPLFINKLSQIDRAWEALEKAENHRETALRESLIKQKRLLHLFSRFEKKINLRENWITENCRLVKQCDPSDTYNVTEAAIKKHEALKTDVYAYSDRIETIHEIADELIRNNFFNSNKVSNVRQRIDYMWQNLLNLLSSKSEELDSILNFYKKSSEANHLQETINSLITKLRITECAEHLNAIEELLQKHELMETEIRSIHRNMSSILELENRMEHLLNSQSFKNNSMYNAFKTRNMDLKKAYSELVALSELRKFELENKKSCFIVISELDNQLKLIGERILYLVDNEIILHQNNVNVLLRRHKLAEIEIENQRKELEDLFNKTLQLIEFRCSNYECLELKMSQVKQNWDKLINHMASRKTKLLFMNDLYLFNLACDDTNIWIVEMHELNANISSQIMETKNFQNIEKLTKKHEDILLNVEKYMVLIEQLKFQSENLSNYLEQQIIESDTQLAKIDDKDEIYKSGKALLKSIQNRIAHTLKLYNDLILEIGQTKVTLDDATLLHQLFVKANSTYNWIIEKENYLKVLVLDEITNTKFNKIIISHNGELDYDFFLKLNVLQNRFSNLETEMSTVAEQVSAINQLITELWENRKQDERRDSNINILLSNKSIIDRIGKIQDLVNTAWNRLADSVESQRDQLSERTSYLTLFSECKSTSEWISDKDRIIKSLDLIDCDNLSGLIELRRRLFNLRGDSKAIEARVENIGSRIKHILTIKQEQEMLCTRDDCESKESRKYTDNLLKEHAKLIKQWMDLKESVKQTTNRLVSEGQVNQFLEKLDNFQGWLKKLKMNMFSEESSNDVQETESRLLATEQFLQEIKDYEQEAIQLFETGKQLLKVHHDTPEILLKQRLAQLEDDWETLQCVSVDYRSGLEERHSLQTSGDNFLFGSQHGADLNDCSTPFNIQS